MKLIVGLGNPGPEYEQTRHNAGFMLVDYLSKNKSWNKHQSGLLEYTWVKEKNIELELIKPQQFMNTSGQAVKYAFSKHADLELSDLFVVYDDLDLKLGQYKLIWDKAPKKHNGVLSITENLKTDGFWHLRLGVDSRSPDQPIPGEKYVLGKFSAAELKIIEEVIELAAAELLMRVKADA